MVDLKKLRGHFLTLHKHFKYMYLYFRIFRNINKNLKYKEKKKKKSKQTSDLKEASEAATFLWKAHLLQYYRRAGVTTHN